MVNDTSLNSEEGKARIKKIQAEIELILQQTEQTKVNTHEQKLNVWRKYILALLASIAFLGGVPPRGPSPTPLVREAPIPPPEPLPRDANDKTDPNMPPIYSDPLLCRIDEILKEGMMKTITMDKNVKDVKDVLASASYEKMIHDLKELQKNHLPETGRDAIEFYIKSLDRISKLH